MNRLPFLVLFASVLSIGCGGGASFSPTYPDNRQADVDSVVSRLRSATPAPVEPVAAGITSSPHRLFLVDLQSGAKRWQVDTGAAAAAPIVAGNLVLLHEARGVVGFDLASGRERFVIEDEAMFLTGAGGDGDLVAFALSTGGGVGARSQLVIVNGGRVSVRKRLDQTLGAPAVGGGMVFVPWATQNLSVLDGTSGDEVARIRITDTPVGWAGYLGGDLYFGQTGIFRLTNAVASGSAANSAFVAPLSRELPGTPTLVTDPYTPTPGAASAVHKIRLDWRPGGSGDSLSFGDDRLYATFYRFVFGLPPGEDGVHFVYTHPEDIVGAAAVNGGLIVGDEGGGLAFIDTQGHQRWSTTLDVQPTAMHIRPGSFVPSGPPADNLTLEDQLLAAAQATDSRLVPARRFAVRLLNSIESDAVTAHLLTICEDARAPSPVRSEGCSALSQRTTGQSVVIGALGRHFDYLAGTSAGPLSALASAAVAMQARDATPMLLSHLNDPHTPAGELQGIAQALAVLGDAETVPPLRSWLSLYHASPRDETTAAALGAMATTLFALDSEDTEEFVGGLAADPLTPQGVRTKLREAIAAWQAAQPAEPVEGDPAEGEEPTEGDTEGDTAEVPVEAEPSGPVPSTTLAIANRVLTPVAARIRACISNDTAHAQSVRIALTLNGDGSIRELSTVPARLEACVGPHIRSQAFPGNTRNVREQLTLTFRR